MKRIIILMLVLLVGCNNYPGVDIEDHLRDDVRRCEDQYNSLLNQNNTVHIKVIEVVNNTVEKTVVVYNETNTSQLRTLKLIQQVKRLEGLQERCRNYTENMFNFDKINESLTECEERICEINRTLCRQGT